MVLKHEYSAKDHSFITYSFVKKSIVNSIELTAVSDLPLFFETMNINWLESTLHEQTKDVWLPMILLNQTI